MSMNDQEEFLNILYPHQESMMYLSKYIVQPYITERFFCQLKVYALSQQTLRKCQTISLKTERCILRKKRELKRLLHRPTGDYTSKHLSWNFSFLEERQTFPECCLIIAGEGNRGKAWRRTWPRASFAFIKRGETRKYGRGKFLPPRGIAFFVVKPGRTRCTHTHTYIHTCITADSPARLIQPFISLLRPPPFVPRRISGITAGFAVSRNLSRSLDTHTDFSATMGRV